MSTKIEGLGKVAKITAITYDTDYTATPFDGLRLDETGPKDVKITTVGGSTVTLSLDKGDYPYLVKKVFSVGTTATAGKVYGFNRNKG